MTAEAPETLTRASAASRESACIVLTMVALSGLFEVKAADAQSAHLAAPVSDEKTWTRLGPSLDLILERLPLSRAPALWGLKSAGASLRNHTDADHLRKLGQASCKRWEGQNKTWGWVQVLPARALLR